MAFDYRDGAGNCPPGYYRPAEFYDCRPQVSGQVYQQQNLQALAAHYVDEGPTGPQTQAPAQQVNQQPVFYPPVASPQSGSGLDLTTLLLIGVAVFFVMKK